MILDVKEYLQHIFDLDVSVPAGKIEVLGRAALYKYYVKYSRKKLFLFGAGKIGYATLIYLIKSGIAPEYVIDNAKEKKGKRVWGIPIIDFQDLEFEVKKSSMPILLLMAVNLGEYGNEIKKKIYNLGIDEIIDVNVGDFYGGNIKLWEYDICTNRKRFFSVLENLGDDESKQTLCEYLRCILLDDFYRLPQHSSEEKYWGEGVFRNVEDESLIQIGGGSGETIFYFLDKYKKFEKITCFEPEQMNMVKQNLRYLPNEIKEKIELEELYVNNISFEKNIKLDEYIKDKKVSLISFDIEGMESAALEGAKELIKKQRPILAISAYHKWDDLPCFYEMINKYVDGYVFYLRKYAALHILSKNEIVFYAVPRNRVVTVK